MRMVDGAEALDEGTEKDIASLGCAYFMVEAGIREAGGPAVVSARAGRHPPL
jgi:hypothetical protein